MSNESLSDISDLNISERIIANKVQKSQIDPSLSRSNSLFQSAPPRAFTMCPDKMTKDKPKPSQPAKAKAKSSMPENYYTLPTSASNLLEAPCKKFLLKRKSAPNFVEMNKKSLSEFSDLLRRTRNPVRSQSKSITRTKSQSKSIFGMKSHSKSIPRKQFPNVDERFYAFKRKSEEKILTQRQQAKEDEVKDCTFKPATNPSSLQQRTSEKFLEDMFRFEVKKRNHLRDLQKANDNSDQETFPFKPDICEKSKRILSSREYANMQCHERLYEMHRVRGNKMARSSWFLDDISRELDSNNTLTHAPRISKKAKELQREKPVDQLLYEDAIRRFKREEPTFTVSTFSPSVFSIRILVRSFLREFDTSVSAYLQEGSVNYSSYVRTLNALRMIGLKKTSEENVLVLKLWTELGGDGGRVTLKDLKVAMMGVMGYFQSWMENSESFSLSQTELLKFHDKYLLFFENRSIILPVPEEPPRRVADETETVLSSSEEQSSSSIEVNPEPVRKKSINNVPVNLRRGSFNPMNSIGVFANAIKVNLSQPSSSEQKRFSLIGSIGITSRFRSSVSSEASSIITENPPKKTLSDSLFNVFHEKTDSDNNINGSFPENSFCSQDISENILKIDEADESDEPESILIDVNIKNITTQLLIKDTDNFKREVNKFAIENNLSEEEERKLLNYAEECIRNN